MPKEINTNDEDEKQADFKEGSTDNVISLSSSEGPKEATAVATPRKKTLMKSTEKRGSRDLYKLVMKPVLNEDRAETSFKRLVPVIAKFYCCNACNWKFEVLDEHAKHIRNYHYEKKNQPKSETVTAVEEKMKENAATKKRYVLGELISNNTQCTICR